MGGEYFRALRVSVRIARGCWLISRDIKEVVIFWFLFFLPMLTKDGNLIHGCFLSLASMSPEGSAFPQPEFTPAGGKKK